MKIDNGFEPVTENFNSSIPSVPVSCTQEEKAELFELSKIATKVAYNLQYLLLLFRCKCFTLDRVFHSEESVRKELIEVKNKYNAKIDDNQLFDLCGRFYSSLFLRGLKKDGSIKVNGRGR
jgi:hypothetical protein